MQENTVGQSHALIMADDEARELPELDSYALADEWASWDSPQMDFVTYLETRYTGVYVSWCSYWRCGSPIIADEVTATQDGDVCESCADKYYPCDRCGDLTADTYGVSGYDWCEDCQTSHAAYCENCDVYYDPDQDDDHDHAPEQCQSGPHGDECVSPALAFTVTLADGSSLAQDETTVVTLPSGEISTEGLRLIRRELTLSPANTMEYVLRPGRTGPCEVPGCHCHRIYAYPFSIMAEGALSGGVSRLWQDKGGNYARRLSSYAYREHKIKIDSALLGKIGTIAREHSQGQTYTVALTRNVNGDAGEDWVHEDSCWFQSYFEGRCALKSNGGMGIRAFDDEGTPVARAWVMPVRKTTDGRWKPTFNTSPDAWLVFNGYVGGEKGWGQNPARILASMLGLSYGKVADLNLPPMYVNGNTGYIVGATEVIAGVTDVYMTMSDHSRLYTQEREALATV